MYICINTYFLIFSLPNKILKEAPIQFRNYNFVGNPRFNFKILKGMPLLNRLQVQEVIRNTVIQGVASYKYARVSPPSH